MIIKKYTNCFLVFSLSFLKVNFLLAKKLNIRAIDVDMILLKITLNPSNVNKNSITKSIVVLAAPTIAKRNLSSCFFIIF